MATRPCLPTGQQAVLVPPLRRFGNLPSERASCMSVKYILTCCDSDGDCVTVKLYENPDDLDGLRWLISCDDSIGVSNSISTLFLDYPTNCKCRSILEHSDMGLTLLGLKGTPRRPRARQLQVSHRPLRPRAHRLRIPRPVHPLHFLQAHRNQKNQRVPLMKGPKAVVGRVEVLSLVP
jgi:hypothetical protein